MPEIVFTPDGQPIHAVRSVAAFGDYTPAGNRAHPVRVVNLAPTVVFTPDGFPIRSVRMVDNGGNYTTSTAPIATQPEDMYTPDGNPIQAVAIISSSGTSPEIVYTADGRPIEAVRLVDASGGAAVAPTSVLYDFTTGSLPAGVTFSRTTQAWGFGSSGVLTAFSTNVPRFVYDPATLAPLGIQIEPSRNNSLRNNTMVGAAAGTPGTLPTNWDAAIGVGGMTRTILGVGVEDGIEYIDVQFSGTPTSVSAGIGFEGRQQVAGASGQTWTSSIYVKLLAGSTAGVTAQLTVNERNAAGSALTATNVVLAPTSAPLRTQRYVATRTFTDGTTAFAYASYLLAMTIGVPIDITLRIGLPQLELGNDGVATSPIKTSTVAVNRATDTALITDARVLTDQCLVVRGRTAIALGLSTNHQALIALDDTTTANRRAFWRMGVSGGAISGGSLSIRSDAGAVAQAIIQADIPGLNADFAIAGRFAPNDYAVSSNGSPVSKTIVGAGSSTGLVPVVTTCRLGLMSNGLYGQCTIKSVKSQNVASDADLVAFSTLP